MSDGEAPEKEPGSKDAIFEERAERFAADIEGRLKRLPIPLLALGDGVCGAVGLLVVYWIARALDAISFEVAWFVWVLVGAGIFAVGLLVRLMRKGSRPPATPS